MNTKPLFLVISTSILGRFLEELLSERFGGNAVGYSTDEPPPYQGIHDHGTPAFIVYVVDHEEDVTCGDIFIKMSRSCFPDTPIVLLTNEPNEPYEELMSPGVMRFDVSARDFTVLRNLFDGVDAPRPPKTTSTASFVDFIRSILERDL